MQIEKVDFVSFLTQDIARAKQFYSEILGSSACALWLGARDPESRRHYRAEH
jgi:hypothetical protein